MTLSRFGCNGRRCPTSHSELQPLFFLLLILFVFRVCVLSPCGSCYPLHPSFAKPDRSISFFLGAALGFSCLWLFWEELPLKTQNSCLLESFSMLLGYNIGILLSLQISWITVVLSVRMARRR